MGVFFPCTKIKWCDIIAKGRGGRMDKVLIKNGKVLLFKDNDVIIEKKIS